MKIVKVVLGALVILVCLYFLFPYMYTGVVIGIAIHERYANAHYDPDPMSNSNP